MIIYFNQTEKANKETFVESGIFLPTRGKWYLVFLTELNKYFGQIEQACRFANRNVCWYFWSNYFWYLWTNICWLCWTNIFTKWSKFAEGSMYSIGSRRVRFGGSFYQTVGWLDMSFLQSRANVSYSLLKSSLTLKCWMSQTFEADRQTWVAFSV